MQVAAASWQSCSMTWPMDRRSMRGCLRRIIPTILTKAQVGCFVVRWTRQVIDPLSRLGDSRVSYLWLLGPTALSFRWRVRLDRIAAVLLESRSPVNHTRGGTQHTCAASVTLLSCGGSVPVLTKIVLAGRFNFLWFPLPGIALSVQWLADWRIDCPISVCLLGFMPGRHAGTPS